MLITPFLRQSFLRILRERLLPWAGSGEAKRLLLLEPPLALPPEVKVWHYGVERAELERGAPLPGRGSFTSDAIWPRLGLHTISFPWLGFMLEGEARIRIGASRNLLGHPQGERGFHEVLVPARSCFLIPPGVPHPDGSPPAWEHHDALTDGPAQILWIHISEMGARCHIARLFAAGQETVYKENFFLLLKDERLLIAARLLMTEMQRPEPFELVAQAALQSFLLRMEHVLASSGAASGPKLEEAATETSRVAVRAACDFIENHLNWQDISLPIIAHHAHVSPTYLNRLFRAELGTTVNKYIVHQRIELAKMLLEEPGILVAEVGLLVGLFPPQHFTRAFAEATGVSPSRYRRSLGGGG